MKKIRNNFSRETIDPKDGHAELKLSDKNDQERTYYIKSLLSEDEYSVLYLAQHKNTLGYLREFYPAEDDRRKYDLFRNNNNYLEVDLIENEELINNNPFRDTLNFKKSYEEIEELEKGSLKIPKFEILHSESKRILGNLEEDLEFQVSQPNFYIWTPIVENGIFLSQFIDQTDYESPEQKLKVIITSLIKIINYLNYILEEKKILLNIDVESFILPFDNRLNIIGNDLILGEINLQRNFDYSTDLNKENYIDTILSIIRILKKALDLSNIETVSAQDVLESKLIKDSIINSDDQVIVLLTKILELEDENRIRYKDKFTLKLILQALKHIDLRLSNEKITRNLRKKSLDLDLDSFSHFYRKFVIANALYKHPIPKISTEETNILVIGFGNYGKAVTDILMQLGKTSGINITVGLHDVNKTDEDGNFIDKIKEDYLSKRPAISRFIEIDGFYDSPYSREVKRRIKNYSKAKDDSDNSYSAFKKRREYHRFDVVNQKDYVFDPYVYLNFYNFQNEDFDEIFNKNEESENTKKELESLLFTKNISNFDYIFVCLGRNKISQETAQFIFEIYEENKIKNIPEIFYIQKGIKQDEEHSNLIPISVLNSLNFVDERLEDLAFNVHTIWEEDYNKINLDKSFKKFESDFYYYSSSIITILGILYNSDIFIQDNISFDKKLLNFVDKHIKLSSPKKINRTNELKHFAHKNWLIGKASDGWKPPLIEGQEVPDFDKILHSEELKDDELKTHARMFPTKIYEDQDEKDFIESKINDLEYESYIPKIKKDPLNDFSYNLRIKNNNYVRDEKANLSKYHKELLLLEDLIKERNEPILLEQYNHFIFYINAALALKKNNFASPFHHSYRRLKSELKKNPIANQDLLTSLKRLYLFYKPFLDQNAKKMHKEDDGKIIDNLPFILTNKRHKNLYFYLNLSDEIIDTVESSLNNYESFLILNPLETRIFYEVNNKIDVERLEDYLRKLAKLLKSSRLKTDIRIYISCLDIEKFRDDLNNLRKNVLKDHPQLSKNKNEFITFNPKELKELILEKIDNIIKSDQENGTEYYNRIYVDAKNIQKFRKETRLLSEFKKRKIKYFRYDIKRNRFEIDVNCKELKYNIRTKIKLIDQFKLAKESDNIELFDSNYLYENEILWKLVNGQYLSDVYKSNLSSSEAIIYFDHFLKVFKEKLIEYYNKSSLIIFDLNKKDDKKEIHSVYRVDSLYLEKILIVLERLKEVKLIDNLYLKNIASDEVEISFDSGQDVSNNFSKFINKFKSLKTNLFIEKPKIIKDFLILRVFSQSTELIFDKNNSSKEEEIIYYLDGNDTKTNGDLFTIIGDSEILKNKKKDEIHLMFNSKKMLDLMFNPKLFLYNYLYCSLIDYDLLDDIKLVNITTDPLTLEKESYLLVSNNNKNYLIFYNNFEKTVKPEEITQFIENLQKFNSKFLINPVIIIINRPESYDLKKHFNANENIKFFDLEQDFKVDSIKSIIKKT